MGRLIQVPFQVDFLAEVAECIVQFPMELRPKVRILLPHRRACRRLREVLIKRSGGLLLPKISSLGEPDPGEFSFSDKERRLPVEVSPLVRRLLLTHLLTAARRSEQSPGSIERDSLLAQSLAQTLDRLSEFDRSLDDLCAPEDHAEHWQRAASFLEIIRQFWPDWCAEHGRCDAIVRRNAALRALAQSLGNDPVIVAASSGRALAVQELMRAVLQRPQGVVMLQGSEMIASEADRVVIARSASHPAYGLARLLPELGMPWTEGAREADFFRAVFRVRGQELLKQSAVPDNLTALVLPDRTAEVAITALLVREAFAHAEAPHVAVIVQDTDFIDSLESWLQRWNLAVDRAAGQPLLRTPEGRLARLILEIWSEGLDVVRLLALLKHPLVRLGEERGVLWQRVAGLERDYLAEGYDMHSVALMFAKVPWLGVLDDLYKKVEDHNFNAFCHRWQQQFERLCQTEDNAMPNSRAAETLAQWWQNLSESAAFLPSTPLSTADFATQVIALMKGVRVASPPRSDHAVSVLSAMEARLMRFDRVIVPMLNYGVLPALVPSEPWLTRQQYQECHLPPPEELLGLAARDFVELCHQRQVFLLRAERINNETVAPSPWWERLDAIWRMRTGVSSVNAEQQALWLGRLRVLLQPSDNPGAGRPKPCPPQSLERLRVSEVQSLFLNPYGLYVRHILRLKERPLRRDALFRQRRGELLHRLAQDYVAAQSQSTLADPLTWFVQRGDALIAAQGFYGREALFLHHALRRIASVFCAVDDQFIGRQNWLERSGVRNVSGVSVRGRADRIVRTVDGLLLIDYKSGTLPSRKSIDEKYVWQLPLLALMLRDGEIDNIKPAPSQIAYWSFAQPSTQSLQYVDSEVGLEAIDATLTARLAEFSRSGAAYPALPEPNLKPDFIPFVHLMRVGEWLEICAEEDADGA